MANIGGIGALINGLQQGYGFMKDEQRKDSADKREQTDFEHRQKQYKKQDDYDNEVMALNTEYYPDHVKQSSGDAPAPAPAAAPTASTPIAVAGVSPDASAPALNAQPATTAPAAVKMASAGTGAATPVAQPKPDAFQNTNSTLDYAIKRAMIDVKHNKLDGAGLVTLQKTVDGMKREKMDDAINLMHQGRFDEAVQAFDSTGDHTGYKVIDAKDGVYKAGKTEVPTKIVTVQDANGNTRVINTAQTLFQRQSMDKIISQAQKDRETDVAEKHGNDVVAAQREGNQMQYNAHMAGVGVQRQMLELQKSQLKNQSLNGQLDQLEAVLGPLDPEKRKTLGMQLAGLSKDETATTKFIDGVVMEGVKAGTVKSEDAMNVRAKLSSSINRARDEGIIANELITNKDDPKKYAASYTAALKILPAPRLMELGFKPPEAAGKKPIAAVGVNPAAAVPAPQRAPLQPTQLPQDVRAFQTPAAEAARQQSIQAQQNSQAAAADPDLLALDQQRAKALRAGNPVAANNAIAQFNALKKERYGL